MAYTDLLDFIKVLDKHGELKRISLEVTRCSKSPSSPTAP